MSNIPEGYTKLAVTGYSNMGNEYDPEKTYYKYNTVYYDGSTYVIIKDGIQGITPTNDGENYVFLAKGFPGDAESVTADDKYDLTQETQNPSGTSNRKTPLQTWLNSAANFIVGKLVHTDAFQDVLKQYIVNNGTTNQEGFALDGRQANPNIEGTLAYEVSQLTNGLNSKILFEQTYTEHDLSNLADGIYLFNGYGQYAGGEKPFSNAWGQWFQGTTSSGEKYISVINLSTGQIITKNNDGPWNTFPTP